MKYQKRLSAPQHYPIKRKDNKYIIGGKGAHKTSDSIPLVVILRDLLEIVENKKEAKKALHEGKVLVDGRKVRDVSLKVGFMDNISIPDSDLHYRVSKDKEGIAVIEISEKESEKKLCKIEDKKILKGGKVQLELHDGSNIVVEEDEYPTKSTIVLKVPEKEVQKSLEFKKGQLALISGGKHSGQLAKIKKVREREGSQPDMIALENDGEFETVRPYVFVVGEKKPEVTVNAEN